MLFSGKIRFHDVARLTARCVLFATICHYSPLFTTIRRYSPLFETIRTIRDYSLFAIRDYSLFAIRVFQTPFCMDWFHYIAHKRRNSTKINHFQKPSNSSYFCSILRGPMPFLNPTFTAGIRWTDANSRASTLFGRHISCFEIPAKFPGIA